MKTGFKILALLLALLLLCACAGKNSAAEEGLTLYYRRGDAQTEENFDSALGALGTEKSSLVSAASIEEVLARYLMGPESEALQSVFPDTTACKNLRLEDGILTLELNEGYAGLSGIDRTLGTACLTLTLTQLESVDALCLTSYTSVLPGQSLKCWTAEDFLMQDMSWLYPERMATLYFVAPDGKLQAEKRAISYQSPELLPGNTLQALLQGPQSRQLQEAVPANVEVLDVQLSGALCTVTLSDTFAACDTDRARAELSVRSIVATLCALGEIEQVQLKLASGGDLTYCSISEPLAPEQDWYQ